MYYYYYTGVYKKKIKLPEEYSEIQKLYNIILHDMVSRVRS